MHDICFEVLCRHIVYRRESSNWSIEDCPDWNDGSEYLVTS